MAYIRIKKINNSPYAYLVESQTTSKGPRQRVKKYLGRVHSYADVESSGEIVGDNKREFLRAAMGRELALRGFSLVKDQLVHNNITVCTKKFTISKGKKEAIIGMNNGFLCSHTLKGLINFKKSDDLNTDAVVLAKRFVSSGLNVSQEEFIAFYDLL